MNQISKSHMPLVSIIVPVYKVQKYLHKCLDSLISQTYSNLEIVLVDDGSPDCSISICKEYALMDSRIHLILQKNSGVASARLNGFLHSHGDLITFVDSDDYVSPYMVERMVQALQTYKVDMVSCQYFNVKDERIIPAPIRPAGGYYDRDNIIRLLKNNFLYDYNTGLAGMSGFLWSRLIRRGFVQEALQVGKGLIHSEDQIGVFKLLYSITSMYVMRDSLYFYVAHPGQATQSYNEAYWKNFELFFTRILDIDQGNYLKRQIPERVMMILKSLIKMEFTNSQVPFFQRYLRVIKFFPNTLYSLGSKANIASMSWKARLQYFLIMHKAFFVYGIFVYLQGFLKELHHIIISAKIML